MKYFWFFLGSKFPTSLMGHVLKSLLFLPSSWIKRADLCQNICLETRMKKKKGKLHFLTDHWNERSAPLPLVCHEWVSLGTRLPRGVWTLPMQMAGLQTRRVYHWKLLQKLHSQRSSAIYLWSSEFVITHSWQSPVLGSQLLPWMVNVLLKEMSLFSFGRPFQS